VSAPTFVYLPGGKAMVRVPGGGGAKKFITDAVQCCCPGCPFNDCVHCAEAYDLSFAGSGDCNCDWEYTGDYALIRDMGVPCRWYRRVDGIGGAGSFPFCEAILTCVYGYWYLVVRNNQGFACRYTKRAFPTSCPAGDYTFESGTCSSCPQTVTLRQTP